jgi:hypothetical protein
MKMKILELPGMTVYFLYYNFEPINKVEDFLLSCMETDTYVKLVYCGIEYLEWNPEYTFREINVVYSKGWTEKKSRCRHFSHFEIPE